jgi:capsid protein
MLTLNNLIYGGGSYADGAKVSTAGKPRLDGSIDQKDAIFPRKMREQINWLLVNEPDISAIVSSLTSKTMGINLNVQVESKVESFNAEAEELIEDFFGFEFVAGKEKAVCDLGGKLHFSSMTRTMSDFAALNGGFLVRHHYNPIWRIPYKVELVGVDMIDVSKGYLESKGTLNGLVRDEFGEITHIWLYTDPKKTVSKRVSTSDITYYSEVWVSIDQQTAVSKLTSILSRLDMASQYGIAELESAIEEAKAGHYIESSAYSELMKIVGEEISKATMGTSGAGRIQAAKDLVTPILRDMGNLGLKAKGLTPVATGDKPIFNTTKRNGIYNDMNANSEMKISASQGMSDIGVYSKAADANYSSIKYTLETDQRTADIRFNDISNRVIFGILARLIQVGIQIGRISDRSAYWKMPNSFLKFRYLRQNKIDTEPAKNAAANKTNIELGVKTKGQIVEERTGTKYEAFLAKKHEQDLMEIEFEVKLLAARQKAFEKEGIILPQEQGA